MSATDASANPRHTVTQLEAEDTDLLATATLNKRHAEQVLKEAQENFLRADGANNLAVTYVRQKYQIDGADSVKGDGLIVRGTAAPAA